MKLQVLLIFVILFSMMAFTYSFAELPYAHVEIKNEIIGMHVEDQPVRFNLKIINNLNTTTTFGLYAQFHNLSDEKLSRGFTDNTIELSPGEQYDKTYNQTGLFYGPYNAEFRVSVVGSNPFLVQTQPLLIQSFSVYQNFLLAILAIIISIASLIATVVISHYHHKQLMEKTDAQLQGAQSQLKLASETLAHQLKTTLAVDIHTTNLATISEKISGILQFRLRNDGHSHVRNIRVYYKDPTSALTLDQLVRDWDKEISVNRYDVQGIVAPGSSTNTLEHITKLNENKAYEIAVWVQFDYANIKDDEFIQIVYINDRSYELRALYDKKNIDDKRTELKK